MKMNKEELERATAIHKRSIIIDGLVVAHHRKDSDLGYFDRAIQSGLTAANCNFCSNPATPLQAMKYLKNWLDLFDRHADKVLLATSGKDIGRAKMEGKFSVILGSQNAEIIGEDLHLLTIYQKLGVRIIQLTYDKQNLLGEGSGERTDGGLTNFGVEVVEEMNRLRILIDVSHCRDQVTWDAIKYSKVPVIASHGNARALVSLPRNKSDEQIKALADKGGVIGLCAWSPVAEVRPNSRPSIDDLLTIGDYIVNLVGVDHLGIGLDMMPFAQERPFDEWAQKHPNYRPKGGWFERNIFTNEQGIDDVTKIVEITRGLIARGYSDQDIEKILGLNFLRVFKEVWGE